MAKWHEFKDEHGEPVTVDLEKVEAVILGQNGHADLMMVSGETVSLLTDYDEAKRIALREG